LRNRSEFTPCLAQRTLTFHQETPPHAPLTPPKYPNRMPRGARPVHNLCTGRDRAFALCFMALARANARPGRTALSTVARTPRAASVQPLQQPAQDDPIRIINICHAAAPQRRLRGQD